MIERLVKALIPRPTIKGSARMAKAAKKAVARDSFMDKFDSIRVGDRIGLISGPGQFPQEGMCRTGTVYSKEHDRFGRYLVLTMDDHSTETVHGLTEVGIGAYLLVGRAACPPKMNPTTVRLGEQKYCSCCGKVLPAGSEVVSILGGRNLFALDCYAAGAQAATT
jgi:hypothetical protein